MVMKSTAIAHPMQGLLKYHGLKDWNLRIPYHDSISVTLDSLWTKTSVEFGNFENDEIFIDGKQYDDSVKDRALDIINTIRDLSQIEDNVKISSSNSIKLGEVKGLGFSSSGGAALAAAGFKAAKLDEKYGWDLKKISTIARRLAGSASRSITGSYSRWHAGTDDESSYSQKFADSKNLDISMIAIPFQSTLTTEEAHREVETSQFFDSRLISANKRVDELENAIIDGDFDKFGKLVELDSLELHSITMTGISRHVLFNENTIKIIKYVKQKQQENIPVYFSMQTGPSIFINTLPEYADDISSDLSGFGFNCIRSKIGGPATIVND